MAHHTQHDYPAGLVSAGDRLVVAEGVALEVAEVRESKDRPTLVVLVLEDGRRLTYPDAAALTVQVWWME